MLNKYINIKQRGNNKSPLFLLFVKIIPVKYNNEKNRDAIRKMGISLKRKKLLNTKGFIDIKKDEKYLPNQLLYHQICDPMNP